MENLSVATEGPVRVLRLDRANKKNALTRAMYSGLTESLQAAAQDDEVRVVVVVGQEGVFSAGNDLMDFVQDPPTGPDSPVLQFLMALCQFEKPILMAVDGPAVGIGTTMLLHAALVFSSARAFYQLPFVPLGLVPEAASSLLLPNLAGLQRASEWLLYGERFSAEQAKAAGVVNEIVAPEALEERVMSRARDLAERPPTAVKLTKKLIRAPILDKVKEVIAEEGAVFVDRLQADETREAMMKFFSRGK